MNVVARPPVWTTEAFLAWEREQEGRFEFDGVRAVEINGGTLAHAIIATNLAFALMARLDRSSFIVLRGDLKVLARGRIRYPDVLVLDRQGSPDEDLTTSPLLVAEVLSSSTARTDMSEKPLDYGAVTSVLHYVLLEQTHPAGMVWSRDPGPWEPRAAETELAFPGLGIVVPLDEVYAGLP